MYSNATNNPYNVYSYTEYMIFNIAMIAFSVFALLCNCFILFIFFRYPDVRNSNCFYRFACLAFCYGLTDFGRILIAGDTLRYQLLDFFEFQRLTCLLVSAIHLFATQMRIIFVVSIAYDRYLAIKTPIAYLTFDHRKRTLQWLAVSSSIALLSMFPYFYGYSSYTDVPRYCTPDAATDHFYHIIDLVISAPMGLLTYVLYGLLLYAYRSHLQQQQNRVLAQAIERQKNTTKVVLRLLIIYAVYNTVPFVIFAFSVLSRVSLPHNSAPIMILFLETDSMSLLFVFIQKHEEFRKYVKIFLGIKNDTGPPLNSALLPFNVYVETAI